MAFSEWSTSTDRSVGCWWESSKGFLASGRVDRSLEPFIKHTTVEFINRVTTSNADCVGLSLAVLCVVAKALQEAKSMSRLRS